jgi:hypothetical protein
MRIVRSRPLGLFEGLFKCVRMSFMGDFGRPAAGSAAALKQHNGGGELRLG